MHWTIYALGSAVFASLVAIFGKIGLKDIDSTLATTIRAVVMALILIMIASYFHKFEGFGNINGKTFLFIILSGLAGALSWLCYFIAIKYGPVGGVVALDRLSVVFALILAAIFLSEAITLKIALGGVLIFAGALLIAL